MGAVERILAYEDGQIDQHRDATWQQRRDNAQRGKPKPSNSLPEGTFEQTTPGGIANTLKTKSKDFDQAMRRLNNYDNGRGRDMQGREKRKIEDSKDALRNAYGKGGSENKNDPNKNSPNNVSSGFSWDGNAEVGSESTSFDSLPSDIEASPYSLNTIPSTHNLDDSLLDTGVDSKSDQLPTVHVNDPLVNAVARLLEDNK